MSWKGPRTRRRHSNEGANAGNGRMDIADWVIVADIRYAGRACPQPRLRRCHHCLLDSHWRQYEIFSLLDAIVLRPLAVDRPTELAFLAVTDSDVVEPTSATGAVYFTNPIWEQVRDRQNAFGAIAAFGETSFDLAEGGEARRVAGEYVSGDYFRTFGVTAAAGRLFSTADDVRGCAGSVVLGYRFWEREYAAAPHVVGRVIRLNGLPFDIAGIADASFRGADVGREPDVYLPICAQAVVRGNSNNLDARSTWWLRVIGRYAAGVDVRQARARLAAISRATFEETIPLHWRASEQQEYVIRKLNAAPAEHGFSDVRSQYGKALFALMAGVALILLIACANVANLLLSRAESRHRELAIRLAIGAARSRVLRQLVTESVVLALAGAVVGVLLARAGTSVLVALITVPGPGGAVSLDLSLNWRLLAFTVLIASLTVVLCGLYPAWRATRVSEGSAMKAQARGVVEGHSQFRLGKSLVVAQVALSLVLVVSALFLVRTLSNLSRLDPGFTPDGVLLATVDLQRAGTEGGALGTTHRQILERVRATPGVVAASSSDLTPIGRSSWNTRS
jgi:predicted permease